MVGPYMMRLWAQKLSLPTSSFDGPFSLAGNLSAACWNSTAKPAEPAPYDRHLNMLNQQQSRTRSTTMVGKAVSLVDSMESRMPSARRVSYVVIMSRLSAALAL